jgi:hypothetical protein
MIVLVWLLISGLENGDDGVSVAVDFWVLKKMKMGLGFFEFRLVFFFLIIIIKFDFFYCNIY